jgi:hypothetical protein
VPGERKAEAATAEAATAEAATVEVGPWTNQSMPLPAHRDQE